MVAGGANDNKEGTLVTESKGQTAGIELSQYEPKSMLEVHESRLERSKFRMVDFHTHISFSTQAEKGIELSAERAYLGTPQELLPVMDRKNIQAMVNLTGGYDHGLADAVSKYDRAHPGRFFTFTEPSYERFKEPNYPKLQAEAIEQAHRNGARGAEDSEDAGTVFAGEHNVGHAGED